MINKCEECKDCLFDDQERPERWGKYWCVWEDKEVQPDSIPAWCPLPTFSLKTFKLHENVSRETREA